jgi:hypothetical protein
MHNHAGDDRHGLAGISQRRMNGSLTLSEQSIREEILAGLLADKEGKVQISTAMWVLAEIIASDASRRQKSLKIVESKACHLDRRRAINLPRSTVIGAEKRR